jgi:hypothetical protein
MRRIDNDAVRAELDTLSRDPFRDVLGEILSNRPSPEALQNLAQRNPDRWGQLLAIVGRLSGFTEKLEVQANVTTSVNDMSDSELQLRLEELERTQPFPHPVKAVEPARQPKKAREKLVLLKQPPVEDSEAADGSGSAA